MTITCPKCKTRLSLPDEKARPGAKVRCPKCKGVLVYKGRMSPQGAAATKGTAVEPHKATETASKEAPPQTEESRISGAVPELEADAPTPPVGQESVAEATGGKTEMPRSLSEELHQHTPFTEPKRGLPRKAVLVGSAGVAILLMIGIFFLFSEDSSQPPPVRAPETAASVSRNEAASPAGSAPGIPSPPAQPGVLPEQPPQAATPMPMTDERAIELVKKSEAIVKMTTVETIVAQWNEKNAGRYKTIVGWQAKKMDEEHYLVSYTALDENGAAKGFYFILNLLTGGVEDLARNPELQRRYNIRYD